LFLFKLFTNLDQSLLVPIVTFSARRAQQFEGTLTGTHTVDFAANNKPHAMTKCSGLNTCLNTLPKTASRIFTAPINCSSPTLSHSSRTTSAHSWVRSPARSLTHRHLAYEKRHAGLVNTTTTHRSLSTRPNIDVTHINIIYRGMATRTQPPWKPPKPVDNVPPLKIYNSLTRQKNEFYPNKENEVTWYSCGPTVYSDSHLGHGRNFVTTDILRRIMNDYFHYNVNFGRWS
jgi:tRNA synthetases class I (C) catalytic domain